MEWLSKEKHFSFHLAYSRLTVLLSTSLKRLSNLPKQKPQSMMSMTSLQHCNRKNGETVSLETEEPDCRNLSVGQLCNLLNFLYVCSQFWNGEWCCLIMTIWQRYLGKHILSTFVVSIKDSGSSHHRQKKLNKNRKSQGWEVTAHFGNHEYLSLDPQISCEKLGMIVHTCNLSARREIGDRYIPGAFWPARVASLWALGSVRDYVSNNKVESNPGNYLMFISGPHRHMHAQLHIHVHTYTLHTNYTTMCVCACTHTCRSKIFLKTKIQKKSL